MKNPILPAAVSDVVEALKLLPGVGTRSAERYAYYLLKSPASKSKQLAESLSGLHAGVGLCRKTFALVAADQEYSDLYTDDKRDKATVMVLAEPFDIIAIEAAGVYQGTYHVLGGLLSPIDGIGPEDLRIAELMSRIKEDQVKEIILGTNASVEGESTALHIQRSLEEIKDIELTRLAQGLPIGVDIEYADQITLARAFEGRRVFNG